MNDRDNKVSNHTWEVVDVNYVVPIFVSKFSNHINIEQSQPPTSFFATSGEEPNETDVCSETRTSHTSRLRSSLHSFSRSGLGGSSIMYEKAHLVHLKICNKQITLLVIYFSNRPNLP